MNRWLGVDFGTKYVGTAVGDDTVSMAMPLKTISAQPDTALLDELKKLAIEQGVNGFVVGLPINMDGTEGGMAKSCRDFAKRLTDHTGLPVEFGDERLSSWEAEGMLIEGGLKPSERKQRVHAVAAKLILEAFFTRRKALNEGASGAAGEQSEH
ncbi:MAG: Holliday junction resolvase RuvX [Planctomycetes bacterium]|nr:Holliday junction resolvase RuvX [Planctomycetota bacterium]MCA8936353.1 Holliday junction resolvase RuvX [Planctomycetota bacterium]